MIRLDEVTKRYGSGAPAVDRLSLDIAEGELCVLVGPSGCGKTTTMKMINRLIEPDAGRISVGGVDTATVDPVELRRGIGYVIQQIGLFPHLTVGENIAVVPRLLRWPAARVTARVEELLALVDLDPATFRDRYPRALSGGQAQRVGVARALAADPPVLLMDEPFGALDPVVRERLQEEFRALQSRLRKTVVFVTHDLDEAVRLGDRIAVLAVGGRLEQVATPSALLAAPATEFVASFVGPDRGVKRLGVLHLTAAQAAAWAPVAADAPWGDTQAAMAAAGRPAVVIVDDDGRALGWLDRDAGRLRPLGATVAVGTTLRDVLGVLALEPTGVAAVLDGDGRCRGAVDGATVLRAAATDHPS